jgi:hypothetical protein
MKKLTILFMLILISTAAFAVKFDPYWFQSRTIIGCFSKEAIPNIDGKLAYEIQNGVISTGLESIDALALEYQIVEIKQAHPDIIKPEWNDNGKYMQNVYRFFLASDDRIDEAVEALNADKYLLYAELEAINRTKFVPDDPMLSQQYTHPLLQSFEAWDYVTGNHDVIVAITDSGVKWNHPDLMGNVWINPAESPGMSINWQSGTITGGDGQDAGEGGSKVDDLVGWDFVENDNNPIQNYSANDHGTHVAGCAAAVGNNGVGVVGTAPNVSILSCKGAPGNSPSQGIQYGYDQITYSAQIGAHVINASWGGPGNGSYPNQVVNYATNLGAVVVSAAGNANTEHTSSYQDYPADCENALNVAATNYSDVKASFSDYGEPIDICAPGDNILSTIIGGSGYASYGGTSMASPVAAGVAALVRSLHPELTSEQLRMRLMMTADPIDDLNPSYAGKLGTGRINSFTATMYDKIPNIVKEDIALSELEGDGDGIPNPGETVSMDILLGNIMTGHGILWHDANDVSAVLRTSYPGVSIVDSVSAFGQNGYLYAASSTWNITPYKFSTIADLPSEPIPFELVVTSNGDQPYPYHKVIPFTIELSLVQEGWPIDTGGAAASSPILEDVNGDGNLEVIFTDQANKVHITTANGEALPGFPLNLGANVVGSIAMSNLQNNGSYGFAASLSNNNIVAFNSDGEILFTQPANSTLRSGPVIARLISGESEKVIAMTQNGVLHVLNPDGSYVPNYPATIGGAFLSTPSVADLNSDGNLEIVACALNGNLHAIDAVSAQNITGFPVTGISGSQNPVTIANLDGDPNPELIVATSTSGELLAFNHDGSVFFQKNVGGAVKTGAVVADVNNDNSMEIILINANGDIYIMNSNGTNLPNTPISVGTGVESSPVVARFDYGSDLAGIIFGDINGRLHSVRVDGTESPNFPIQLSGNVKVSAALSDLDHDGDLDIVVPDNGAYYVIDIKRQISDLLWPCYLGTYNRSSNSFQPTPSQDELINPVATSLSAAYPNPFNPQTTLSFNLQEAGDVSLVIFNQRGQRVRSMVNGSLPAGKHQVVWNGTDDNGSAVSSGLYFFRMKTGKYSSTRKMVLMK